MNEDLAFSLIIFGEKQKKLIKNQLSEKQKEIEKCLFIKSTINRIEFILNDGLKLIDSNLKTLTIKLENELKKWLKQQYDQYNRECDVLLQLVKDDIKIWENSQMNNNNNKEQYENEKEIKLQELNNLRISIKNWRKEKEENVTYDINELIEIICINSISSNYLRNFERWSTTKNQLACQKIKSIVQSLSIILSIKPKFSNNTTFILENQIMKETILLLYPLYKQRQKLINELIEKLEIIYNNGINEFTKDIDEEISLEKTCISYYNLTNDNIELLEQKKMKYINNLKYSYSNIISMLEEKDKYDTNLLQKQIIQWLNELEHRRHDHFNRIQHDKQQTQQQLIDFESTLNKLSNGSKFELDFGKMNNNNSKSIIRMGKIDDPLQNNLSMVIRLNENYQEWKNSMSDKNDKFCQLICQHLQIPKEKFIINDVQCGSVDLHIAVQSPHGQKVMETLTDSQYSDIINYLNITSIEVGYLKVEERFLSPEWNRTYLNNHDLADHENAHIDNEDVEIEGEREGWVSVRVENDDENVDNNNDRKRENNGIVNRAFWNGALDRGGKPYYCPKGWVRFGIKIAKDAEEFDQRWGDWHIAYHGTGTEIASAILNSGIKPTSGRYYTTRPTLYVSPSIEYCAHPRYAEPLRKHNGTNKYHQLVLQCRVNPRFIDNRTIRPETILSDKHKDRIKIDENFDNNELEWIIPPESQYITDDIICYGIMLQISDGDPAQLPSSCWWKYTHDYLKELLEQYK
ncbi:unnamed protein product [Didymodactylos carnosus]|uniref:Uncharacterized protein n=1 Tax=Didymodactylos carnosus TaxID=1234261 RepID=A0A814YL88_9BILA|nr:unnamed protein product [Didymodactylos carnosus]CAF3995026.1 unnamed protein product [Didymodactylos carnosus]